MSIVDVLMPKDPVLYQDLADAFISHAVVETKNGHPKLNLLLSALNSETHAQKLIRDAGPKGVLPRGRPNR